MTPVEIKISLRREMDGRVLYSFSDNMSHGYYGETPVELGYVQHEGLLWAAYLPSGRTAAQTSDMESAVVALFIAFMREVK